jgi:hypothetical protein
VGESYTPANVRIVAMEITKLEKSRRRIYPMSIETGVLTAMAIGIIGGAILTGWAIYSRHLEKKNGK